MEAEIEAEKSVSGSARSHRSYRSHRSQVQLWINQSQETPEKQPDEYIAATTSTPIISSGNVVLEVPCWNDNVLHHQNAHQPVMHAQSQVIPSVAPVMSAVSINQFQQQPASLGKNGIIINKNPQDPHAAFPTVQNEIQHSSAAQQVTFHDPFGPHPPGQSAYCSSDRQISHESWSHRGIPVIFFLRNSRTNSCRNYTGTLVGFPIRTYVEILSRTLRGIPKRSSREDFHWKS